MGTRRARADFEVDGMDIPNYFDLLCQIIPWWDCAGEEARRELLELLEKRSPADERKARLKTYFRKANYDRAVDYSNDVRRLGDCFVYAWISEKQGVFYVGSGSATRVTTTTGRPDAFTKVRTSERCKVVVLCLNASKDVSLEIEKGCIWLAQILGARLTNKSGLLAEVELESLHTSEYGDTPQKRFFDDFVADHKSVASLMNDVVCGAYKFTEENGYQVEFYQTNKDSGWPQISVKYVWTINGETKPAAEWCRAYGVNLSVALSRIKRYRLTPIEAMTFPNIGKIHGDRKNNRKALKIWAEMGYVAGTDKTSYVTPLDEWPREYGVRR